MGPTYTGGRQSRIRHGREQLRDGAIAVARDAYPMLACLIIPAAIVLGIALYAAAPDRLAEPPVPAASPQAPGPYDGFRFEAVGAGVRRFVDDGTGYRPGDYRFLRGEMADAIAIDADGALLACCDWPGLLSAPDARTTLHRLGDPDPVVSWDDDEAGLDEAHDLAVAGDGKVWVAGDRVVSFTEDEQQPVRKRGRGESLWPGGSDAMWVSASGDPLRIVRIDRDGRRTFDKDRDLPKAVRGWGDRITGIATTPNGWTWVGVGDEGARRPGGLLRFDGESWRAVRLFGRKVDAGVEGLTVGADGTLWVYLRLDRPRKGAPTRTTMHLARRDATGWTVSYIGDGVAGQAPRHRRSDQQKVLMRAAPDGTVWLTPFDRYGCARLVSFTAGRTAEHLPDGACVRDLELDADGRAWVSVEHWEWAGAERTGADLYLVDPVA